MKTHRQLAWLEFLAVVTVAVIALVAHADNAIAQQAPRSANAAVPTLVQFSGVLHDESGKPMSDTVGVTFLLYRDQQGGAPLWLEAQNVQPDKTGHYSVMLGSTSSIGLPNDIFVAGEARWLAVQAQGQDEQPRVMLLSVPYALKAGDAETVGGLPPSAFVLATPAGSNAASSATANPAATSTTVPPPSSSAVTTTGGTVNALPLWTTATNIQSSSISQTGSGATAKIGINTATPGTALDVNGAGTVRGVLTLPATGAATSAAGKNSQPQDFIASVFNRSTSTAVPQKFQWQAEPAGNNTTTASGTLNLLYASGTSNPAETGLKISSKGLFTFATGQTFPGTGTITGVTAGSGLTGGGTTGSTTLNVDTTKVMTGVVAGTDLTGGGTGGVQTLSLDTSKVPLLAASNVFTGNQTVNGNVSATGLLTGTGFQIGSSLFAYGSAASQDAFLGFAGNASAMGGLNTAVGSFALSASSVGTNNTAIGVRALANTTGTANTAVGYDTGLLFSGLLQAAGSGNTFLGYNAALGNDINNGTAIGVSAEVDQSNSLVLGAINGVNGATADTNVGIGTTTPQTLLHIDHKVPAGGQDVSEITSGGSTDVASLLLKNTGSGGLRMRVGVGTGSGYLASSGALAFITADTGTPSNPSSAAMTIDNSGNVNIKGNLSINGSISKNGGSFKIDHPLDPANKYLYHSFVESPDMMNIYNGVATFDARGSVWITMPDYFEALNRDFRYQLTSMGRPQPSLYVAEEISGNRFRVAGGKPGGRVSWQVTGIRHDAYADAHRIPVEEDKPSEESGHYMHPELFGAPEHSEQARNQR